MEPSFAVEVHDLRVRFGPVTALDGVSWTASAGQITAVLGPNGAGKSTTFACIEGYVRPDSGSIRVLGLDPIENRSEIVRHMGVMLQAGGIPPAIRCAELLEQYRGFFDRPLDVSDLLDTVGLAERRDATWRSMSGGEQQRLALALALVGRPSLVILDEPTSGIDAAGRNVVRDVLTQLRNDGVSVILSTHDLDDAEELADHLVIVHRGTTVAEGTPAALLATDTPDDYRLRVSAPLDVARLSRELGADISEDGGGWYRIARQPSPDGIAALARSLNDQNVLADEIVVARRRLEDAFLALTADHVDQAAEPNPGTVAGTRRTRQRAVRT